MTSTLADAVEPVAARRLREATRDEHQAVERIPLMRALADGALDATAYAEVLRRHYVLIGGWEAQLHDWLETLAQHGWRYHWRSPALRGDLAALCLPEPALAAPAPVAPAPAFRWGMLYVIEGSQLGGRLIARGLRARQPGLAGALRYFEFGEGEPSAWRRFQRTLDRVLAGAADQAQAVAGARAMFAHFHRHLAAERPA